MYDGPIIFSTWAVPPTGHTMWQREDFVPLFMVRASNEAAIRPPGYPRLSVDNNDPARFAIANIARRIDTWHEYIKDQRDGVYGPVAFFMQHWGRVVPYDFDPNSNPNGLSEEKLPPLMQHSLDRVDPNGDWTNQLARNGTIYSEVGAEKVGEYTDKLINALVNNIDPDTGQEPVPPATPVRLTQDWNLDSLLWDLEQGFYRDRAVWGGGSTIPTGPRGWFTPSIQSSGPYAEPRYDTEDVLEGKTLKELYEDEAGSIPYSDGALVWATVNHDLTNWLGGLYAKTLDWRMDQVLYQKFRDEWRPKGSAVICGNYNIALADADDPYLGGGDKPWLHRVVPAPLHGDYVAPEIYPESKNRFTSNDYEPWGKGDWTIQDFSRWLILQRVRSAFKPALREGKPMFPWILATGSPIWNPDGSVYYTQTHGDFLWVIDLCLFYGVRRLSIFMATTGASGTTTYSDIPLDEFGRSGWDRILAGINHARARVLVAADRQRGRRDRARV